VSGFATNTIPANAVTSTQGVTNGAPAQATLNVGNASGVTISKVFAPNAIAVTGVSQLTIAVTNTSTDAITLSSVGVTDALPANVLIAATPNASTTCPAGTVAARAGGTAVSLTGATLPAGSGCTFTVAVTSATLGSYLNTIPANAVTSAQGATNGASASATLIVGNASPVTVTNAFTPPVIAPGATSTLTITVVNSEPGAIALTGVGLTDALPPNVVVAATPNASTTCTSGTVTAAAAGSTIVLSGASLPANASCTITVNVTGTVPGVYTTSTPPGAVSSNQGATNAASNQASLTIVQPSLAVTKTSVPSATTVSPGETVTYTVVVKNAGGQTETTAVLTDKLTNATLVPGSVTVNGVAAADGIVTAGVSFGSIAPGATTTITYRATVNASAPTGALVTNLATISGDQPCSTTTCSSSSPANTVAPPILTAVKAINGQPNGTVLPGETVAYSVTVSNTGATPAFGVTVSDTLATGLTIVPGSVTVNGATAGNATIAGQLLIVPIGSIASGATSVVSFNVTFGAVSGPISNTALVAATGLPNPVQSNTVVAQTVPATIVVTKAASATVVTVGDRVDYTITAAPTHGIAYGSTTIVDTLPSYEVYAPGTARVGGKAQEPVVAGHTLTWTLPALTGPVTITYATVIAAGAPTNGTLTNTVVVSGAAPGNAPAGRGSASASVTIVGSTFGSCYPITGRVYLDANGTGRFDDPDVGIAQVAIFLDNGESATTDPFGRYDFPCVHPGMHALRLDTSTLPPGVVPFDDRNIDSEKSTRRLVHHTYDTTIIEDINFALTGKLRPPPPPK
jgi:uncharacterized repeat protein (TIGR01451 family)/fimbrial isopeptide formation D2 family protein